MEEKLTKTFRFYKDVIKHSENNPNIISFAEEVCKLYREKYMNVSEMVRRLENIKQEENWLIEEIRKAKAFEQNPPKIPLRARRWIANEGAALTKKYTVEGVCKRFNKMFDTDLTYKQFKLYTETLSKDEI